jgi:carbonic anhydrase
VLISLENLMTFPFIRENVEAGNLSLHGVIHDIAEGTLLEYSPETDSFALVG